MATTCDPVVVEGNVGLAFGLVTAAGMSTSLGAALAFVMPRSSGTKNLFLAASLAIAAGVMIYVSFVEIFAKKALDDFRACVDQRYAPLFTILSSSPLLPSASRACTDSDDKPLFHVQTDLPFFTRLYASSAAS